MDNVGFEGGRSNRRRDISLYDFATVFLKVIVKCQGNVLHGEAVCYGEAPVDWELRLCVHRPILSPSGFLTKYYLQFSALFLTHIQAYLNSTIMVILLYTSSQFFILRNLAEETSFKPTWPFFDQPLTNLIDAACADSNSDWTICCHGTARSSIQTVKTKRSLKFEQWSPPPQCFLIYTSTTNRNTFVIQT